MTNDDTTQLTSPLSNLREAPVGELHALLESHPYCQNLHYLHLAKELQKAPDTEPSGELLARIATYATDREFLYHRYQFLKMAKVPATETGEGATLLNEEFPVSAEDGILTDDFSDELLDDLSHSSYFEESVSDTTDLDRPFAGPNQLMPEEDAANGQSILEKILESADDRETTQNQEPAPDTTEPSLPIPSFKLDARSLSFLTSYSKILREKTVILDPKPKSKVGVVEEGEEPSLSEHDTVLLNKPVAKAFKKSSAPAKSPSPEKSKVPPLEIVNEETEEVSTVEDIPLDQIVENSLAESEEIASETLAELLTSQQQYKKALAMYERLVLIFPEKSSFFAEKIKHLKKILS